MTAKSYQISLHDYNLDSIPLPPPGMGLLDIKMGGVECVFFNPFFQKPQKSVLNATGISAISQPKKYTKSDPTALLLFFVFREHGENNKTNNPPQVYPPTDYTAITVKVQAVR